MRGWPEDGAPADLEDLVTPLHAWWGERIKWLQSGREPWDYEYTGPEIGDQHVCLPAVDSLSREGLAQHEEQGRDPLNAMLTVAVQLGIEQGRRLASSDLNRQRLLERLEQHATGLTRAQIVDGTGFPRDAKFIQVKSFD